jgi:transposase
VVWWRRTGVPWRDLPEEFGPWKTVFNRFDRWSKNGRWTALLEALQTDIASMPTLSAARENGCVDCRA